MTDHKPPPRPTAADPWPQLELCDLQAYRNEAADQADETGAVQPAVARSLVGAFDELLRRYCALEAYEELRADKISVGLAQQGLHMARAACKALGQSFEETAPVDITERIAALEAERDAWIERARASEEEAEKVLERANAEVEKRRALEAAARPVLAFADYAANSFDRCATPERQALRGLLSKERTHA